jgi:hypothetical protein
MFFLLALGKCATRKAMRAGRFLDKSAFLLGHGARNQKCQHDANGWKHASTAQLRISSDPPK